MRKDGKICQQKVLRSVKTLEKGRQAVKVDRKSHHIKSSKTTLSEHSPPKSFCDQNDRGNDQVSNGSKQHHRQSQGWNVKERPKFMRLLETGGTNEILEIVGLSEITDLSYFTCR